MAHVSRSDMATLQAIIGYQSMCASGRHCCPPAEARAPDCPARRERASGGRGCVRPTAGEQPPGGLQARRLHTQQARAERPGDHHRGGEAQQGWAEAKSEGHHAGCAAGQGAQRSTGAHPPCPHSERVGDTVGDAPAIGDAEHLCGPLPRYKTSGTQHGALQDSSNAGRLVVDRASLSSFMETQRNAEIRSRLLHSAGMRSVLLCVGVASLGAAVYLVPNLLSHSAVV